MLDISSAIIMVVSIVLIALVWAVVEQRKKERIFRELNRLHYHMTYTVNCIEMSRLTLHGSRDRDDYLNEAVESAKDASEIAINLSKEI